MAVDKLTELRAIIADTTNAHITLMPHEKHGWSLRIRKCGSIYVGSLDEVVQCAIDHFLSYRKPREDHGQSKTRFKNFIYN